MKNSFIDEQGNPISVQFSKSENVDLTAGDHAVSDDMLGGTLYVEVPGEVNFTLLYDENPQVKYLEAGHSYYRVKTVHQANTTATGLKIYS